MNEECIDNDKAPTVLVVEDDITVRLLAQQSLSHEGFVVIEAEDGAQALAVFQEMRPDIILMDVDMPTMDGFEACRRLRQSPQGRLVPILMATGFDDFDSIQRAYQAGATDFASKPLNWLVLGHRLRYILRASQALQALQKNKERLAHAQRIAHLGNWEWDLITDEVYWSEEIYRILGLSPWIIKPTLRDYLVRVHPEDQAMLRRWFIHTLRARRSDSLCHRIRQTDGTERTLQTQAHVQITEAGRVTRMSGTVQDVSERKQAEEQIHQLAYFDTLTGLANRRLFKERFHQTIKLARRHKRLAAILFMDLDDFKRVNDTLGHDIGDLLLKTIAERLLSSVRSSDSAARPQGNDLNHHIARLGGDEFTVLLTEIDQVSDAAMVAKRILEAVSRPATLAGHDVVVTPSVGIAVYPYDGEDVESLIKHADMAMYHAKRTGKNLYQFYAESMNVAAQRRLRLENALRKAIAGGELFLEYQPQMDLWQDTIVGIEALLRWHNDTLGHVLPTEFISLAEETGLILPIGEWVLKEACTQAKAWQDQGLSKLRVAVNISPRQFTQKDLPQRIAAILEETGLNPNCLELEITETPLMQDVEEAIQTLYRLKALGIHLAIDDFGTGYSSLSHLKRFPIDRLKIDRSFVNNVVSDPSDAAVTLAVVSMAHSLKLQVIAEGVETEAQQAFLKQHCCDQIQGFLVSRPLPSGKVIELIRNHRQRQPFGQASRKSPQRTVLLVDDEPGLTTALKRILRAEGYQVLTAASAQQAFDLLAHHPVQVVISDQMMSGMTGIEFLKRVRWIYPHTVRLVLSGKSDIETVIAAVNDSAIFKFLTKPVAESALKATLREAFLLAERQS